MTDRSTTVIWSTILPRDAEPTDVQEDSMVELVGVYHPYEPKDMYNPAWPASAEVDEFYLLDRYGKYRVRPLTREEVRGIDIDKANEALLDSVH